MKNEKEKIDELLSQMDNKTGFLIFHLAQNLSHFYALSENLRQMVLINNGFIKKTEELIASGENIPEADDFLRFAKLFEKVSHSQIIEVLNLMKNKEEENNGNRFTA